jgi:hypothetical protein
MRLAGALRTRVMRRRIGSAAMVEWHPRVTIATDGSGTVLKPGWSVVEGALAGRANQPHSDGDLAITGRV